MNRKFANLLGDAIAFCGAVRRCSAAAAERRKPHAADLKALGIDAQAFEKITII
jgi:hypothetical protein